MRTNRKVLVLNQSYQPISLTTVKKAVNLAWRDKVELVETADHTLRSAHSEFPSPLVIRLKGSVKFNPFGRVELTRKNLFRRDGGMCVYCGSEHQLTVDHVLPKSRGGKSTWDNLVTACHSCNNKKDNKTPDEAGLHLGIKPKQPHYLLFMTQNITPHEKWKPYLYMTR